VAPRQLIVVGVDGSSGSTEALRWAMRQASATAAEVIVVAVWEVPTALGYALSDDAVDWAAHAREIIDNAMAEAGRCQLSVTVTARIVRGHVGTVLVEESRGADLLVVGSRGHGMAVGMLLGSVSEYCVHHAACPVVVVGPHRG
jgi:nucleotide-binding universal stress UspA family protein